MPSRRAGPASGALILLLPSWLSTRWRPYGIFSEAFLASVRAQAAPPLLTIPLAPRA